jgi:hypothetical protein
VIVYIDYKGSAAKRYQVIFPTDVGNTIYGSIDEALAAADNTNLSWYGAAAYTPGKVYVSFKTSANPVLNCFSGGAQLSDAHTYVDYYYSPVGTSNILDLSSSSGYPFPDASYICGIMRVDFGASVGDGLEYLDREDDPVITSNNVDTTSWGPCILVPYASTPWTSDYPMFANNCTNYTPIGQAIMAPFTIIRGLDD